MVLTNFDTAEKNEKTSRITLFLIGACAILSVFCACLVAALVLAQFHAVQYDSAECSVSTSVSPPKAIIITTESEVMLGDGTMQTEVVKPLWETDFRLPSDTLPLNYDLFLNPHLSDGTFSGEVTIRIQNLNSRTFFAVNTKHLDIYETRLTRDGQTVAIKEPFEFKPNEFWIVRAKEEFEPGLYLLHLKFKGDLTGRIVGFYRSVYSDHATKQKRTIATSKFQPTYARQAFPCFDEPSFKSTFTVKLVRPTQDYIALSNMNEVGAVQNADNPDLTTVTFETSELMVTYLACFIVCDFESKPSQNVTNLNTTQVFPFTVYSTPAQVDKTAFALETGVNITSYYIKYFDIEYPLPKLDMIAIPDFVSGAMEHWGLITFREVNLLYSSDISSTTNKQRVATVVAHELAHMWFGNLMTLKWWDDLWLNEGFASYMEYKGTDHAYEDWKMMDQFLIDDLHPVLMLDAVLSSHPIVQTVGHPDEITELFDTISYNKGAAVIRMLEDFLGEEAFRNGIHEFLETFKFSNAVTQDLWNELQKFAAADINVTQVMDTWTRQMGYPVISMTRQNGSLTLIQKRFLADPNANVTGNTSPYGYKWDIPITYITDKQPDSVSSEHKSWLRRSMTDLNIIIPPNSKWVKFNFHQIGYYRVNYDDEGWNQLRDALLETPIPLSVSDRAHLLDDVFSLADASLVEYSRALEMSKYLKNELDYVPWAVASSKFSALKSLLTDSLAYPLLRKYVQTLVSDAYNHVTWKVNDDDSHLLRRLRVSVLSLACSIGHSSCLEQAGSLFNTWLNPPTPGGVASSERPNADIRQLVYYHGMSSAGNEANWDILWQLYLDEEDAQEKTKLLYGLTAVKEPWLLRRFIQLAKNENYIRSQDYFSVIQNIAANPIGTPIVWDFVRSEWEYLVNRFTLNDRYLGRMVGSITSSFSSKFKLQEMESFFAQYPDAGAGTTARKQALEAVDNRIKWLERNEEIVRKWLETQKT